MDLQPTYHHPDAERYLAPGGAWRGPALDELLRWSHPDAVAVVDGGVVLTGAQLDDLVARTAGGLRAAGVGPGAVVAWQLPNWHEAVVLARACWRIGAVAAPLHHRGGGADVAAMLDLLEPSVVLGAPGTPAVEARGAVAVRAGDSRFDALRDAPPIDECSVDGAALATVQFTSGSTGSPKAVLHSHRTLATKTASMVRIHGLDHRDAVLMPSPFGHISGLLNGILVPGAADMKVVLVDRWDPALGLEVIERERVSYMIGPPTLFLAMAEQPGFRPERVASMRVISSGAMGVRPEFVERASEEFGAVVKRSYGSTEAPTVTTTAAGGPAERARNTDGRAHGDTRVAVFDPDALTPLGPGDVGEVWVQGPELFVGYALPQQTDLAVRDGWFRTGDLGHLDEQGWLQIDGRLRDLIIRAGENISPTEVEAVLDAHPSVRQSVVVGKPDARLGERVVAFVVSDQTLDVGQLGAWFAERGVARFKTPELVVRLEELPLLPVGKPDRAALRERAKALAEA